MNPPVHVSGHAAAGSSFAKNASPICDGSVLIGAECVVGATMPGPSNTFISAPVRVMRPSGKITSVRPSRTALTIAFAAIAAAVGATGVGPGDEVITTIEGIGALHNTIEEYA